MAETESGMLSGGAAGFQVAGPFGMIIGAAAGAFLGNRARKKRKEQELKILKANTSQAYRIGDETLSGINKTREDIGKNYTKDLASAQAKFAARGGRLEGSSYQAVLGTVARARDESLTQADLQEEEFRGGEAFKFIQQDYNYSLQAQITNDPTLSKDRYDVDNYAIRTEGLTGESYFTDEQKSNLQSINIRTSGPESGARGSAFETYRQAIMPTFEQFQSYRYGSDEDKSRFETELSGRITDANTVFTETRLEIGLRETQRREQRFLDDEA